MQENEIARRVLDICFAMHRTYGPGLFEHVYEEILCYELQVEGFHFRRQHAIPVVHKSIKLEAGFKADVIVEDFVILELKSVEQLKDIHFKQLQTYLKLSGIKLGLLINFNVSLLKNGIHRIANNL
ncbi:GxxExxY protein [Cnuella takakiae]|nr:GxxExxY protein [Cnuella takakiae]